MIEKFADRIADMVWAKLEGKIIAACEEGYKRGELYGYVDGREDGGQSATDDLIRRLTFLYDAVRQIAKEEAYAEAGAIPINEISEEEFKRLGDN